MSSGEVAVLGAIAGLTIFLGLPIGRVRARMEATKATLNAVAIGVLLFLLWDILSNAWEPVDEALATHQAGKASADAAVLLLGFGVGFLGLVWFDQWIARRSKGITVDAEAAPK